MVKSEWIICLGGNDNQIPYIEELKIMGYKIILFDKNQKAPAIPICDLYRKVGYDDFNSLKNIVNKLREEIYEIKNIFSASSQFSQLGVSFISNHLNLKSASFEKIEICLDKKRFYKLFLELKIPIPITFLVNSKQEIYEKIKNTDCNWYLKSDYGKSPNYIYKINVKNIDIENIFWGRDRYLRDSYILQKEFFGDHLRINIINQSYLVFSHSNNKLITSEKYIENILNKNIIVELRKLVLRLGFNRYICKFDLIINENSWSLLDIGIDPPSRMLAYYKEKKINFYELYIKHFFGQKVHFPYARKI